MGEDAAQVVVMNDLDRTSGIAKRPPDRTRPLVPEHPERSVFPKEPRRGMSRPAIRNRREMCHERHIKQSTKIERRHA
jgi:hypothetical protein